MRYRRRRPFRGRRVKRRVFNRRRRSFKRRSSRSRRVRPWRIGIRM